MFGGVASADQATGELKLDVDHLVPDQRYFVLVGATAATVFGIGQYQLQMNLDTEPGQKLKIAKDDGENDTRATATSLDLPDGRLPGGDR